MQIEREVQVRICPYCKYNKNEISQPVCVDCGQVLPITAKIVTRVIKVEAESLGFSPGMHTDREIHEKVCTYCNAGNPPWSSFCAYCGQPLQRVCANCGAGNPSWGSFCTHCGDPLPITPKRVVRLEIGYAGFWRRFLAFILDIIIVTIISIPLILVYTNNPEFVEYYDFAPIIFVLYFIVFWSRKSQTPGKMALGIRIVTEQGNPISTGRAIVRYFGYIVGWFVPVSFGIAIVAICAYLADWAVLPSLIILWLFGMGIWWIGWDKKKQGWHDKIANTYVIKG
ncbi:MAG: RDD family protein [Planctomycetes bacterium]|nr:RDD family protein [Planctomycetota bacterium]